MLQFQFRVNMFTPLAPLYNNDNVIDSLLMCSCRQMLGLKILVQLHYKSLSIKLDNITKLMPSFAASVSRFVAFILDGNSQ